MKAIKISYWIITILFALGMLFTSVSTLADPEQSNMFMHDFLGYPGYFAGFISWMKILGCIAILVPGFPRIKEWAFAGLMFDLLGATYSLYAAGTPVLDLWMMILFIAMGIAAYTLHRKKQKLDGTIF